MATSDKPRVTSTLSQLDGEGKPEPYRLGLPGSKIVTFPDPGELDWIEAEQFMEEISGATNSMAFARWLSDEDYEKLVEARPNLRQIRNLTVELREHYGDVFGVDQGEGQGSTES